MGRPFPPRWSLLLILLGFYLTFRGYQSYDGDQAYRLPLLLHHQDPSLYRSDPFVRSFDTFNPHRGYLGLLDLTSRVLGLPFCLFFLFSLTFALTFEGLDRLARLAWPESGPWVGVVAVVLTLTAKAGNIGTNHLFEAMLLDRLLGFALGWVALAAFVARPGRGLWVAPPLLGLAAWVHPSVGLQLALWLGTTRVLLAIVPRRSGVSRRSAVGAVLLLAVALVPGSVANTSQADALFRGMDHEDFYLITAYVQSPQHMLPHLWRMPQWLAWACYPILASLALIRGPGGSSPLGTSPRSRLVALLMVNLAGLVLAWVAIEWFRDLRITLFQPFRMATTARGLCLVALSGHVFRLWREGGWTGQLRAGLLLVGLSGDWSLVVATTTELAFLLGNRLEPRLGPVSGLVTLGLGLGFLAGHDVESGQIRLLTASSLAIFAGRCLPRHPLNFNAWRLARLTVFAWAVPLAALVLPALWGKTAPVWVEALAERCRFGMRPTDDVERLALWCRDHTPPDARFIGPPGPKTFRLWSYRSLTFNRAGTPYHAAGLADWIDRFRDHVGFDGSLAAFARAYLDDRQALERRYDALTPDELAALARRQGATHVLAAAPPRDEPASGSLEHLKTEGHLAVYRLQEPPRPLAGRPENEATTRQR